MLRTLLAIAMIAAVPTVAAADVDLKKGKKVYNKCKTCHVLDKEKNKVGPHLVGIIGREAGAVDGFPYSNGLAEADWTWTEDRLLAWLEDRSEDGTTYSDMLQDMFKGM